MATVVVRVEAQAHGHTQKAIVVEAVGKEVVALIMELTRVVHLPLMVIYCILADTANQYKKFVS